MDSSRISRREAGRKLFLMSAMLAAPAWLIGCGKKELACVDTMGLTPDEVANRISTLQYVDKSPDPNKTCAKCNLFKPAGENACGGCQVVKGPINPAGNCKSWVAKAA